MFKSNQRLMNRWRLDHKLSDLDRIERWVVWDLQTKSQHELLTPTPEEHIHTAQPKFFMKVHQANPVCIYCGLEDQAAYAIYPLGTSEFQINTKIAPSQVLDFLSTVQPLLEAHGNHLYPSEITVHNGTTRLRPLGQTLKQNRITVDPCEHPDESNPNFTLAMMVLCSVHPTLNFGTKKAFVDWIEDFNVDTWLPDVEPLANSWISAAVQSANLPALPSPTHPIQLSPIQIETDRTELSPHSTLASNARRDVPLPKYLLCTARPSSPSVAKQIAAISHVPLSAALDAYEHGIELVIDGANTWEESQTKLKRYENLPLTVNTIDQRGLFAHSTIRNGFNVAALGGLMLTGLGFGYIPLGIGAGVWCIGRILQSRQVRQQDKLWKTSQQVGLQKESDVTIALQAARQRVLLSDLPSLAIADLIKEIDRLEEMSITAPQQAIDLANQIHIRSGNIDQAIKKSLQQTEDLVKSSIQ